MNGGSDAKESRSDRRMYILGAGYAMPGADVDHFPQKVNELRYGGATRRPPVKVLSWLTRLSEQGILTPSPDLIEFGHESGASWS